MVAEERSWIANFTTKKKLIWTIWTKHAQQIQDDKVRDDQQRVGLKGNEQGILEYQDRVQGHYPVYLPDTHPYKLESFLEV